MGISSGSGQHKNTHIVAMPYPGRGHVNPMLNLCKLILLSNSPSVSISFVVTQEWLGFLGSEPLPASLRLVGVPQVIPSEVGRAADFPGFIEATMTKLRDPFERLLDRLEPPPTAIVYDTFLAWVVHVGNRRNIPVASLFTMSASVFTFFSHFTLLQQRAHFPPNPEERGQEKVDYIPGLPATTIADLPTIFEGDGRKVLHRVLEAVSAVNQAQYLLFTSINEFEGPVMEVLKRKLSVPIYHIGPLIPYFLKPPHGGEERAGYLRWLDSQPEGSVLYVSQGSFLSASGDQVDEFIAGVRESGVRFLWVTRGDSGRFGDGPGEKGLLVPWCDQLKVLCHPSVGGFWTHCGWNSTSEGVYAGVPMLTCPIFFDQMPNSKLIVSDWKIGRRVITHDRTKAAKGKGLVVTRQEIADLVRSFMDSDSGQRREMVRRARSLRDDLRSALATGGSAASDLDAFLRSIS